MSRAATGTCVGALKHAPLYAEVDRHHVRPTFLCDLLGVPKERRTVSLCSGCHDLAHHVLTHLINTGKWGAVITDAWMWRHNLPDGLRWQRTVAG